VLRFCCLGSGSEGNALVVEVIDGLWPTRVLVDNGFNLRQLKRRMARAGLGLDALDAIVITHEHADHAAGVAALARRRRIPVFATAGTARACGLTARGCDWRPLKDGHTVGIGGLAVRPYAVPHDASEPVQFVFSDGAVKLGLLTDIGSVTDAVVAALGGMQVFILECNHDAEMLRTGPYPYFLKTRIGSDHGHLSNAQAAALLARIDRSVLRSVIAAHLSRSNNRPALARAALAQVLNCGDAEVEVADQDQGLTWRAV
jgi:phosphoribosyl 1,2-cyclic phosphodiesterase